MRNFLKFFLFAFLLLCQYSCGDSETEKNNTALDTQSPASSVVLINNSDASTSNPNVNLSLQSSDNVAVTAYFASESSAPPQATNSGWIEVSSSAQLDISTEFILTGESQIGSYQKTIYVWFKDDADNISNVTSDSINFEVNDTEAPIIQSINIDQNAESTSTINLSVTIEGTDNYGITGYLISEQTVSPTIQSSGWEFITASTAINIDVPFVISAESAPGNYTKSVNVWIRDEAGNISLSGSDDISLIVSDVSAPVNTSLMINNNASSTSSTHVVISLAATDNIGITDYCLSENASPPDINNASWESILTATANLSIESNYTLSSSSGLKTVYSWYKDAAGNISASASDSINLELADNINIGTSWMFFGDSQTAGRANETSVNSHVEAFSNIWNQTFNSSVSPYKNGIGGRVLEATKDYYLSRNDRSTASLVHFQESGGQYSSQDSAQKFAEVYESMVRAIVADSPNAIISNETAYSFEAESEPGRDWTQYNIEMIAKITALQSEGITVYLAQVDRNIKELVARKRIELGTKDGQESVWGDTDNSIGRHYTGLGNLMVALSIYDALQFDLNSLDLSNIPENEVSSADKQLCIDIINSF